MEANDGPSSVVQQLAAAEEPKQHGSSLQRTVRIWLTAMETLSQLAADKLVRYIDCWLRRFDVRARS